MAANAPTDSRVRKGTLEFKDLTSGQWHSFACQPTSVRIVPENTDANTDTTEVLCGQELTDESGGGLGATLQITAVQDFTAPTGESLIQFSWLNNMKTVEFRFSPTGKVADRWDGTVQVQALDAGGAVNTRLTSDASWTIKELDLPQHMGGGRVVGNPPKPTITTIVPATGDPAGGTAVVITGKNFTGATGVKFGVAAGTAFTVVDDATIHVTTPAVIASTVDVVVESPNGDAVEVGGFVYA